MRHDFSVLSPVRFLDRAAAVHGKQVAVVDGDDTYTYAELHTRARQLSGALFELDLRAGGRVAVLAPNTLEMLEAHYGVPLAGGVLVALNIRLSAREIGYILSHSGARLVLCDTDLAPLAKASVAAAGADTRVIREGDEYERLLAAAEPIERPVTDERGVIAINYTSGTTGTPKGVMYHHRGAYLQSLAMVVHSQLQSESKFLWTLPMFHCNGWCFTWAVTAAASTHVCLRRPILRRSGDSSPPKASPTSMGHRQSWRTCVPLFERGHARHLPHPGRDRRCAALADSPCARLDDLEWRSRTSTD